MSFLDRLRRDQQHQPDAAPRTAADCRKELAAVLAMYAWGVRGFITVGALALLFTMVNVQIFGSAGHELGASQQATFHWVTAWLLDPMASVGLGVAILFEALLARHDRHEPWLTVVKWFAGVMTWAMNIWPAIDNPHPSGVLAGVVLHSLAPGLVLGLAEAAPRVRRWVGEIVAELEREAQEIEARDAAERQAAADWAAAERQAEIDAKRAEEDERKQAQIRARELDVEKTRLAGEQATRQREHEAAQAATAVATVLMFDRLVRTQKRAAAARRPRTRAAQPPAGDRSRRGAGPARTATPPDVSDLLPAGRDVADRLAADGKQLTRSALVKGLRAAGMTCSTDRAGALVTALREQRSDADGPPVGERSGRPLHAVAAGGQ